MTAKPHVLVLGGGFAALESAFLMRMRMRDRVDLTLVSDPEARRVGLADGRKLAYDKLVIATDRRPPPPRSRV